MTTYLFIRRGVILTSLVLISWLPALAAQPGDQPSRGATPPASPPAATGELSLMASGAAEDTLKACLARIPKDASVGQRMVAEQGCARDAETRKLIEGVPAR